MIVYMGIATRMLAACASPSYGPNMATNDKSLWTAGGFPAASGSSAAAQRETSRRTGADPFLFDTPALRRAQNPERCRGAGRACRPTCRGSDRRMSVCR
jgi:hypothetical protein